MKNWVYIVVFLMAHLGVAQTNYYVNDGSTSGDVYCTTSGSNLNDGLSPSSPKADLSGIVAAYSAALTAGDTIFFDAGTYYSDEQFTLPPSKAGLTFIGAGSDVTIFDNQLVAASTNYFMYINASNTTFKNMSFTGYENNGTQTPGHSGQVFTIGGGGAITNILFENVNLYGNGASGGNPALSVLSNAQVTLRGGGSFCNRPTTQYTGGIEAYGTNILLNVENYLLANNFKTSFYGGGLHVEGDNSTVVNLLNCRISNNHAEYGGGISQFGGVLTVKECIIESNDAGLPTYSFGGGYYCSVGQSTFSNCIFRNNQPNSNILYGGAIGARYIGDGDFSAPKSISITVDSCLFDSNTADKGTHLYTSVSFSTPTSLVFTDCEFVSGGASQIHEASGTITGTYFGSAPSNFASAASIAPSGNTYYSPSPSVPEFTGDCASGITILPVELAAFEGKCQDLAIELMWQTTSEYNNAFFIVERAGVDGQFELIAKTPGSLNSSDVLTYYFTDEHPKTGLNYYRLSQVDVDGRSESFEPITVYNNCSSEDVVISYSSRENSLILSSSLDGISTFEMYALSGELVFSKKTDPFDRFDHVELSIKPKPSVYLVRFIRNGILETGKVIILN